MTPTTETLSPVALDPSPFATETVTTPPPEDLSPAPCANQPNGGPFIPDLPETLASRTRAMADLSKRWPNGMAIQVGFLNGTDPFNQLVRQAVLSLAPTWSDYANLTFVFPGTGQMHIGINFLRLANLAPQFGTYSSFIGTDCVAKLQRGLPSMHLVFNPNLAATPAFLQQEFSRVILHEFGHAIGLIHEHQRPDRKLVWNIPALVRKGFFGGDVDKIKSQIIAFYTSANLAGTAFDLRSIMMYPFDPGLATFEDGTPFQTPVNVTLSPMDKVLANMLYPASVASPTEEVLVVGEAPRPGAIGVPGQVARYSFRVTDPGVYAIDTSGAAPLLLSVLAQRGEPAGQLLAVEGANASLLFRALNPNKDYFVEVRHARPMKGTGTFSISVRQQA